MLSPDLARITTAGELDVPGIGHGRDGQLTTYHVTDNPKKILGVIRAKARLMAAYGRHGASELGAGLYVSGSPDFWLSRARAKWSFLKNLSEAQEKKLIRGLRAEVEKQRRQRWITATEAEYAERDLNLVEQGVYKPEVLVGQLANQPYNIAFWKPEFLEPLGISSGTKPVILQIRMQGPVAELRRAHVDPRLLRDLRKLGLVGAFTRAGAATAPEMVVWDVRAIRDVKVEAQ